MVLLGFAPALLTGRLLAPAGDGLLYYYPVRAWWAQALARGELPTWTSLLFAGYPAAADSELGLFFPLNWPFLVLPAPQAMNLAVISAYVLAALFTWAYVREIGGSRAGAALSGLAYAGSGFLVAHLAHLTIVHGAAVLPLTLLAVERLRRRRAWAEVALAAGAVALQLLAGHPQIALYALLLAAASAMPGPRPRHLASCAAVFVLGLLLAACQLLPTAALAAASTRRALPFEAFVQPALPVSHLALFLFPHAFGGGPYGPYAYAGEQRGLSEALGYVGVLPLLLALASLALWRGERGVRFWAVAAVLAVLAALGPATPLAALLHHVPLYNLFRAPGRHLMEVDFALAVLAGLAFTHAARLRRALALAAAAVSAAFLGTGAWLLLGPPLPVAAGSVLPPLLVLLASVLAAARLASGPAARPWALAVLVADLACFAPLWYGPLSCPPLDLPSRSPLLEAMVRAGASPWRTRTLFLNPREALADFTRAEPNSSLLRRLPSLGGSSSLVLARFADLAAWTEPIIGVDLPRADARLPLLGVGRLVVAEPLLSPPVARRVEGVGLGPEEHWPRLSAQARRELVLELPEVEAEAVELAVRWTGEAAGREVLRLDAQGAAGERSGLTLNAPPDGSRQLHARWRLTPGALRRLTLRAAGAADAVQVERLALTAGASRALELAAAAAPLALRGRSDRVEAEAADVPATAVDVITSISGPTTLGQGQPLGHLRIWTDVGVVDAMLRAGLETAEWAWDRPDVRPRIAHRRAAVAEDVAVHDASGSWTAHRYRARVELGGPRRIRRLALRHVGPDANLVLDRAEAVDDGQVRPLPLGPADLQPLFAAPAVPAMQHWSWPTLRPRGVRLLLSLGHAALVRQGEVVARLTAWRAGRAVAARLLRAGVDLSEWAWERPDLRGRVRHARVEPQETYDAAGFRGHRHQVALETAGEPIDALSLEAVAPGARLEVAGLALEGPGGALPASLPALFPEASETRLELALPPVPATEVALALRLSRAAEVAQGAPVLRVFLDGEQGRPCVLRAGVDLSEWRLDEPEVARGARHGAAPGAFRGLDGHPWWLGRCPLGREPYRRLVLEPLVPGVGVALSAVSLHDARSGRSTPLGRLAVHLAATPRWRRVLAAEGAVVYEDREALPRAWLVGRTEDASEAEVRRALGEGRPPDGLAVDPRRTALTVAGGPSRDEGPVPVGAEVWLMSDRGAYQRYDTHAARAAFLVMADVWHPDWSATVDGHAAPLERAFGALRGVWLPAGDHHVELRYRPWAHAAGLGITLVVLAGLVLAAPCRRLARGAIVLALLTAGAWAVSAALAPRAGTVDFAQNLRSGTPPRRVALDRARDELGPGWHEPEAWADAPPGRWTDATAELTLRRTGVESVLRLDLSLAHPSGLTRGWVAVGPIRHAFAGPNGRLTLNIDVARVPGERLAATITSERAFVPREYDPGSADARRLGVFVHSAELVDRALE